MRKKRYSKHVGVLFTDKVYDKIVKITDTREIPISQYIREVVEDKIKLMKEDEEDEKV